MEHVNTWSCRCLQRLMDDEGPVWSASFVDPWTALGLKPSFGNLAASRLLSRSSADKIGIQIVVVFRTLQLMF